MAGGVAAAGLVAADGDELDDCVADAAGEGWPPPQAVTATATVTAASTAPADLSALATGDVDTGISHGSAPVQDLRVERPAFSENEAD